MLATKELNYKELQTKLHELRDTGVDVQVKLNSKYEVLLAEYKRLTEVVVGSSVSAEEKKEKTTEEGYTTEVLPALNQERAPSFLGKTHTVYWIDNGCGYEQDWLDWELDHWLKQHEGVVCYLEVMEELEALTLQALERDNVENGSFDEQEEETLRPSVEEPTFSGAPQVKTEEKEEESVGVVYMLLALPVYLLIYCLLPALQHVLKVLLRSVERHVSTLGMTEQKAYQNLREGIAELQVFLVGSAN